MLTPNDIRNALRPSGYNHVTNDGGSAKPWRAASRWGGNHGSGIPSDAWRGPRRATPLEAAQDYCNYMNGLGVSAPATLKSPGHKGQRDSLPRDEEIEAALGVLRDARGRREGRQGYVYLIAEIYVGGGIGPCKIGFSTNPEARVAELQVGNPRKLTLLYAMPGTEADEAALHAKYAQQNILLEWFSPTKDMLLEFPADCAKVAA